MHEEGELSL